MKLKDIRIKRRIFMIVFSLVAFMAAISIVSYYGLRNMDHQNHVILEHAHEMENSGDLQLNLAKLVMPVNDYLITGDLKLTREEFNENLKNFNAALGRIKKAEGLSQEESRILSDISSAVKNVEGFAEKIFAVKDVKVNQYGSGLMEEMDKESYSAIAVAEGFHEIIQKHMNAAAENADRTNNAVLTTLIVVSAISIFLGIALGFIIGNSINRPLGQLIERLVDISEGEGDLTARLDINQKDEIGDVSRYFNKFVGNIHDLVSQVLDASQNLSEAVQQIAAGNENLSQRTSEQASSLEEIASTIEEATSAINQNAGNAQEANRSSDDASKMARDGNEVVERAVDSITLINETSKRIAEIITVINDIAFQTNLLALNAAVEAARAGEQGRGFAVVAGEVRNLAQRSGNAAKEIEDLIKDSVNKVEIGTELVIKSGESLKGILQAIDQVSRLISEINASSQEQKQGINQVNLAVTELDQMTQDNASLVEETASASEEMANQAQDLLSLVQQFRVDQTARQAGVSQSRVHLDAVRQHIQHSGADKAAPAQEEKGRAKKNGNGRKKETARILHEEGFEEF